jgi:hypothetical protein
MISRNLRRARRWTGGASRADSPQVPAQAAVRTVPLAPVRHLATTRASAVVMMTSALFLFPVRWFLRECCRRSVGWASTILCASRLRDGSAGLPGTP